MKKLLLSLIVILISVCTAKAQLRATPTAHDVALSWVASTDAALNPTLGYQVYRLNGACPATLPTNVAGATGFVLISGATPLTTVTYTDFGFPATPLPPGTYCYFVVSSLGGAQSNIDPTGITTAVVLPAPPTGLAKQIT